MSTVRLQHPEAVVESTTKGWRVDAPLPAERVRREHPRLADLGVSWPLATLDADALDHNTATMARACARAGVLLAPHLKTHMSAPLLQLQLDAGAWGPTVATPAQARVAFSWGCPAVLLANELVDAADAADLLHRARLVGGVLWCYVDSRRGVQVLAGVLTARPQLRRHLGVLVELGATGARTGVRGVGEALSLARAAASSRLPLVGTAGYEGAVTASTDVSGLAAAAGFVDALRDLAAAMLAERLLTGPPVVSVGGSSYLDVVLQRLPRPLPDGSRVRGVVRSGAYLSHDHGMYARSDPWRRMVPAAALRPALDVRGQVLSVPEPGLALVGLGRRDVGFDQDLPLPLTVADGPRVRPATGRVTALNDQHAFLREEAGVQVGEVVTFGISHPCTLFDKWRVLPVLRGERVVDLVATVF